MATMATHEPTEVGVFDDLGKAEATIDELRQAGFRQEEIGIIGHMGENQNTIPVPAGVKAPETTAISGFMTGSLVGLLIGTLVILVIPGLGDVSGAGRWFEILGGAILGAVAGGVLMAYGGLLLTRAKTRFFRRQLEQGRFIVTVNNPNRRAEALAVLHRREATPMP